MIQKTLFFLSLVMMCVLVSCGSYKRNTTETNVQKELVETQTQQNDKIITETVETTLDFFGDDAVKKGFEPQTAQPKQWSKTTKKTKTTVDKGTYNKNITGNVSLKKNEENKENPWRPPWYVSGLAVLVLLVVYKVFKTKYQIVKRN